MVLEQPRIAEENPLQLRELETPSPGAGQIRVRVLCCGLCHTDLHTIEGDLPLPKLPLIPGHQIVGFIDAMGEGVHSLKEGDRVGIPWLYTACGYCPHCRTGWETLCAAQKNTGYSVNGSFAEYALADPNYVGRLPTGLDWGPAAPILCAGVTVYKGLKETEVKPGEWVAISGIGGLGHMAVQYAKAMGMHVAAIDIHPEKLALATKLGAEIALNARDVDPAQELQKRLGGVHGALVTAVSPTAFEQAFGVLRSHGTMALVGLPPGTFALPIFDTVLKRITIRGSIVGTRQDLEEALDFAGNGAVAAHFSWDKLENINAIFARMEQGGIDGRIVLQLD
ncbi:MAG: zinc-dependent alcohol dehydrogenase [Reyranella sp.]